MDNIEDLIKELSTLQTRLNSIITISIKLSRELENFNFAVISAQGALRLMSNEIYFRSKELDKALKDNSSNS